MENEMRGALKRMARKRSMSSKIQLASEIAAFEEWALTVEQPSDYFLQKVAEECRRNEE